MGRASPTGKSFEIPKRLVYEAWKKVQANGGAPGVDRVSITTFESRGRDLLYKLWNRMSAGSYMPAPVRAVEIPKDHGAGVRVLGVPTTADRVAQTAVAMLLEERLEPIIHARAAANNIPPPSSVAGSSSFPSSGGTSYTPPSSSSAGPPPGSSRSQRSTTRHCGTTRGCRAASSCPAGGTR